MPYYVYRVRPMAQFECLAEFAAFRDASAKAKVLRAAAASDAAGQVKVIFAADPLQAEDLLCQIRDPKPGDED